MLSDSAFTEAMAKEEGGALYELVTVMQNITPPPLTIARVQTGTQCFRCVGAQIDFFTQWSGEKNIRVLVSFTKPFKIFPSLKILTKDSILSSYSFDQISSLLDHCLSQATTRTFSQVFQNIIKAMHDPSCVDINSQMWSFYCSCLSECIEGLASRITMASFPRTVEDLNCAVKRLQKCVVNECFSKPTKSTAPKVLSVS